MDKVLKNLTLPLVGIYLLILSVVSQFLFASAFGFYEDDYAVISRYLGADLSALPGLFFAYLKHWPSGRPLGYFLGTSLSTAGSALGGLYGMYVLALLILVLNCFLLYLFVFKISSDKWLALLGATVFCLYPPDTTRAFLCHSFELQPSLTFFLLASLMYLNGYRFVSCIVAALCLLTYESPFPVFIVLPLIVFPWNRQILKPLALHAATMAALIFLCALYRKAAGEERVLEASTQIFNILKAIRNSLVLGPATTIHIFLKEPFEVIKNFDLIISAISVASALVFYLVFRSHKIKLARKWWFIAIGLLVSGYFLSFTHYPPTQRFDRGTSVHLAGSIGGALLFALILARVAHFRMGTAIVGAYLGLLMGYKLVIQMDYARNWSIQKTFWSELVHLCPDAHDETVIFVRRAPILETKYLLTHSWGVPLILGQIYQYPQEWKRHPRVFFIDDERLLKVEVGPKDGLRWWVPTATWWAHWEPFPHGNFILLDSINGHLNRVADPLVVGNNTKQIRLVPKILEFPLLKSLPWKPGVLYQYLIRAT